MDARRQFIAVHQQTEQEIAVRQIRFNKKFDTRWVASVILFLVSSFAHAQQTKSIDDAYWVCSYDFKAATATRLFAVPELNSAGSVSYSPDKKLIAFDGNVPGKHSTSAAHIFVCKPDGSDMRDLGPGAMPSWSPRGRRIAFSRYSPDHGVWIMDADGSNDRLLDNRGWCAQWSPNGQMIAYTRRLEGAADFVIFNLVEDEISAVFGDGSSQFTSFNWNFSWSPDSRRICMKATKNGQVCVATVNATGAPVLKQHLTKDNLIADYTWLDNSTVITPMWSKSARKSQLFQLSIDDSGASVPRELPGQFTDRINTDADVSRSGDTMLFVSRKSVK